MPIDDHHDEETSPSPGHNPNADVHHALEQAAEEVRKHTQPRQEVMVDEKVDKILAARRQVRDQIDQQKLTLTHNHQQEMVEVKNLYETRIYETARRLRNECDEQLEAMEQAYQRSLYDLEQQARRMV
jgi:hypothetical protein